MAHEHDFRALLRGGVRDGQVTSVTGGLTRLITMSDAPGLLDVYERDDAETGADPESGDALVVFAFSGQESAEGIAPELQHMPGPDAVPGDT